MSAGLFNQIDPASGEEQDLIAPRFASFNFDVIDGVEYRIDLTQPARYSPDGKLANEKSHRIVDLKYGMGVPVDAMGNQQLMIYALGALEQYGVLCDFDTVSMYIHMPRLNYVGECHMSTEDLLKFADDVRAAAGYVELAESLDMTTDDDIVRGLFTPGEK